MALGDIKNTYLRRSALVAAGPFLLIVVIIGGGLDGIVQWWRDLWGDVVEAWRGVD
ncbi:hypothetical protein [Terrihabitans soli]|uniref:hypothetical protein n=1 Tax=Terrihabitans soli TaxID=708113 RepID=UPI001CA36FCE|nr:hypothetical protein [Terrihabitans soli]